jgi:hypothetical protein
MNFYTLGLPRTRSRWLSLLLTDEHSDCHHERLTLFGANELPPCGKRFTGSADTNPLNPVVRRGPLVIVERDVDDAIASFLKAFDNPFQDDFEPFVVCLMDAYQKRLDQFRGDSVVRVPFESLDDPDCVRRIADYLRPGTKMPRRRAVSFCDNRITTKNRDLRQSIALTAHYYRMPVHKLYESVIRGQIR